jgi:ABC-type nitrate/sulfonate/bicarbonate transport system substrate-binding protein
MGQPERALLIEAAKIGTTKESNAMRNSITSAAVVAAESVERMPKPLHASVRKTLRQAWELADADKAARATASARMALRREERRERAKVRELASTAAPCLKYFEADFDRLFGPFGE